MTKELLEEVKNDDEMTIIEWLNRMNCSKYAKKFLEKRSFFLSDMRFYEFQDDFEEVIKDADDKELPYIQIVVHWKALKEPLYAWGNVDDQDTLKQAVFDHLQVKTIPDNCRKEHKTMTAEQTYAAAKEKMEALMVD